MSSASFDVLGIGNAIVDVISHADDAFIARHNLSKGSMPVPGFGYDLQHGIAFDHLRETAT